MVAQPGANEHSVLRPFGIVRRVGRTSSRKMAEIAAKDSSASRRPGTLPSLTSLAHRTMADVKAKETPTVQRLSSIVPSKGSRTTAGARAKETPIGQRLSSLLASRGSRMKAAAGATRSFETDNGANGREATAPVSGGLLLRHGHSQRTGRSLSPWTTRPQALLAAPGHSGRTTRPTRG
jgi:hypothetical protein